MSKLIDKLKAYFRDKETRHVYVDEFLNEYLATQIKVLREQREWSQKRLAEEAGVSPSYISTVEDVSNSSWTIPKLKSLAKAFDVVLNVSFVTFGERLRDIDLFSRKSLERLAFENDPVFLETIQPFADMPELSTARATQVRANGVYNSIDHFQIDTATAALSEAVPLRHRLNIVLPNERGQQRHETAISTHG